MAQGLPRIFDELAVDIRGKPESGVKVDILVPLDARISFDAGLDIYINADQREALMKALQATFS